jgi:hypothetical protein
MFFIILILLSPVAISLGPVTGFDETNLNSYQNNPIGPYIFKSNTHSFFNINYNSHRYADNDNLPENATIIDDATFFNKTIIDNLSGFSASGDDLVDFYKIYLDNHAEDDGLNADKLSLWLNTSMQFDLYMIFADPDFHVLATTETGFGLMNGSITLSAQSAGYHYIVVWLDPFDGYAEYNITYNLVPETNILLDNNNDFDNGSAIDFTIIDMGSWEKLEYKQATQLDQYEDIHDFYNLTVNSSDNMTLLLEELPNGNLYGVEVFNNTNISQQILNRRFYGGINNTPIYFDFNYTGNYSLRIYSVYEDPYTYGGSGRYVLSIVLKPQNHPPEVRLDVNDTIYMYEDDDPIFIHLNETIFFDPDVNNTNDSLNFFIIDSHGNWTSLTETVNLQARIQNVSILRLEPKPDVNTSGENITIVAIDWQDWNISHNITVIIYPVNDEPQLTSINEFNVKGVNELNLSNDENGTFGAFEDIQYNLTIVADDIDNNDIDFQYSSSVNFKSEMGFNDPYTYNLSFSPTQDMVGIVQVNVSINESNNLTIQGDWVMVDITVNNTNDPPEIAKVNDKITSSGTIVEFTGANGVFAGSSINFTVTALDPDLDYGDILRFNTTNLTFIQRDILELTQISQNSTNISFKPTSLDVGYKFINITVKDLDNQQTHVILKVEVREAEKKYSLDDEDCTRDYNDQQSNDDYTFYELVYRRANSPISYRMMAYTNKGDFPGVNIINLASRKVGDYMNVTVKFKEAVEQNTTVKVFYVLPFEHYERPLDINAQALPEPYTPLASNYILSFSFNDPLLADTGNPVLNSSDTLEFSIHLGTLENSYGIKHNVEFGLFAQAYKMGTNDYNYFSYDSVGVGSVAAPEDTVSYLLTYEECQQERADTETDDVYGYQIKFKDQDRTAGLTIEKTERGGMPDIDILRVSSRRVGFYFEVILNLADKVSNDTLVSYSVYIVTFNHTENGVHLTPSKITDTDYPKQYAPEKEYYYQLAKYNAGTTLMADKTIIDENKITFSFHLGLLQHPELGNLSHNSNFGVFATAVRESNSTSILDYGFYYDAAGLGVKKAPALFIVEDKPDEEEEVSFWLILGHFFGIPILIIIIIAIIVVCIIWGYATVVKNKYRSEVIVDVPPVPPVPSARGTSSPEYGVWPGKIRDDRYYEYLYHDEPEVGYDEYGYEQGYGHDQYGAGIGAGAGVGASVGVGVGSEQPLPQQSPSDDYTYDVIPEEDESLFEEGVEEQAAVEDIDIGVETIPAGMGEMDISESEGEPISDTEADADAWADQEETEVDEDEEFVEEEIEDEEPISEPETEDILKDIHLPEEGELEGEDVDLDLDSDVDESEGDIEDDESSDEEPETDDSEFEIEEEREEIEEEVEETEEDFEEGEEEEEEEFEIDENEDSMDSIEIEDEEEFEEINDVDIEEDTEDIEESSELEFEEDFEEEQEAEPVTDDDAEAELEDIEIDEEFEEEIEE